MAAIVFSNVDEGWLQQRDVHLVERRYTFIRAGECVTGAPGCFGRCDVCIIRIGGQLSRASSIRRFWRDAGTGGHHGGAENEGQKGLGSGHDVS
jgi:hypothetical protein